MSKIKFSVEQAKTLMEKAKVLMDKGSRLYIKAGYKANNEVMALKVVHVCGYNQHVFSAFCKRPSDFEENACYMSFIADARSLVSVFETLLLFDAPLEIEEKGGQFYVNGGNKSKKRLDVMEYSSESESVFISAKTEEDVLSCKVSGKEFIEAINKGGSSAEEGGESTTGTVSLIFKNNRIAVASSDNVCVSTAFTKKILNVKKGGETVDNMENVIIGLAAGQMKFLKAFLADLKSFEIQLGDKHIYLVSEKKDSLALILAKKCIDYERAVVGFMSGGKNGSIVIDTEELEKSLKVLSGLTERRAYLELKVTEKVLKLISTGEHDGSEAGLCVPVSASDGDLESFPPCLALHYVRDVLSFLDNGNVIMESYVNPGNKALFVVLRNESPDGESVALHIVPQCMKLAPKKEEDKKEKKSKKADKAEVEETKDETAEIEDSES